MDPKWNDTQPIYRQLRDRVVTMILEGVVKDGDALPSVRQVAAEYQLNPLTVLKGYQALVDEELVEKKRGRGMYVKEGANTALMADERRKFVEQQWPEVAATIKRLGLDPAELVADLDAAAQRYAEKTKHVPTANGAARDTKAKGQKKSGQKKPGQKKSDQKKSDQKKSDASKSGEGEPRDKRASGKDENEPTASARKSSQSGGSGDESN